MDRWATAWWGLPGSSGPSTRDRQHDGVFEETLSPLGRGNRFLGEAHSKSLHPALDSQTGGREGGGEWCVSPL